MSADTAEQAIRKYLNALKDPSTLRDDQLVDDLKKKIEETGDELERVRLRQQLMDAENPTIEPHETAFITHAKAWAEAQGITAQAFKQEGVSDQVLRKAGLVSTPRRGADRGRGTRQRTRVTTEEVRKAIPPRRQFTVKTLQETSGASPAVVRKVINEELEAGRLAAEGADPDHQGPGRAPTLYRRR